MKRKVVFFVNSLYGGGAEKVLQTLLRHLDRQRFDITLYSLHWEKLDDNYPSDITYRYIYGHGKWSDYLKTFVYQYCSPSIFYRLFVKGRYDTEVAFIEGYSTRIVSGSTNKMSKKVAWVHSDLEQNHWTDVAFHNRIEEKICYGKFDAVVAVSKTVQRVNDNLFPTIKSSLYIYNPVSNSDIILQSQKVSKTNYVKNGFTFVTSGRLTKQKGFDRLIDATRRLLNEGYSFHVVIIGEGKERRNLEELIEKHSLTKLVTLIGFLENPHSLIRNMDCFVCSSRAEGFSLVILEAMILGLPIIATNCSGPNELVGESQYGLLVDNSVDGIYEGMKWILDNPREIEALKEKSLYRSYYFEMHHIMECIETLLL